MNKRPLSITALGWLFIVVGVGSLISLLSKSTGQRTFGSELFWIRLIQLLAVLGGAFTLRGFNWARWPLVAWMAFHAERSFAAPGVAGKALVNHHTAFQRAGQFAVLQSSCRCYLLPQQRHDKLSASTTKAS